jgi:UDP-2,3-diacylglucosamine pyrophosphatase LpxH
MRKIVCLSLIACLLISPEYAAAFEAAFVPSPVPQPSPISSFSHQALVARARAGLYYAMDANDAFMRQAGLEARLPRFALPLALLAVVAAIVDRDGYAADGVFALAASVGLGGDDSGGHETLASLWKTAQEEMQKLEQTDPLVGVLRSILLEVIFDGNPPRFDGHAPSVRALQNFMRELNRQNRSEPLFKSYLSQMEQCLLERPFVVPQNSPNADIILGGTPSFTRVSISPARTGHDLEPLYMVLEELSDWISRISAQDPVFPQLKEILESIRDGRAHTVPVNLQSHVDVLLGRMLVFKRRYDRSRPSPSMQIQILEKVRGILEGPPFQMQDAVSPAATPPSAARDAASLPHWAALLEARQAEKPAPDVRPAESSEQSSPPVSPQRASPVPSSPRAGNAATLLENLKIISSQEAEAYVSSDLEKLRQWRDILQRLSRQNSWEVLEDAWTEMFDNEHALPIRARSPFLRHLTAIRDAVVHFPKSRLSDRAALLSEVIHVRLEEADRVIQKRGSNGNAVSTPPGALGRLWFPLLQRLDPHAENPWAAAGVFTLAGLVEGGLLVGLPLFYAASYPIAVIFGVLVSGVLLHKTFGTISRNGQGWVLQERPTFIQTLPATAAFSASLLALPFASSGSLGETIALAAAAHIAVNLFYLIRRIPPVVRSMVGATVVYLALSAAWAYIEPSLEWPKHWELLRILPLSFVTAVVSVFFDSRMNIHEGNGHRSRKERWSSLIFRLAGFLLIDVLYSAPIEGSVIYLWLLPTIPGAWFSAAVDALLLSPLLGNPLPYYLLKKSFNGIDRLRGERAFDREGDAMPSLRKNMVDVYVLSLPVWFVSVWVAMSLSDPILSFTAVNVGIIGSDLISVWALRKGFRGVPRKYKSWGPLAFLQWVYDRPWFEDYLKGSLLALALLAAGRQLFLFGADPAVQHAWAILSWLAIGAYGSWKLRAYAWPLRRHRSPDMRLLRSQVIDIVTQEHADDPAAAAATILEKAEDLLEELSVHEHFLSVLRNVMAMHQNAAGGRLTDRDLEDRAHIVMADYFLQADEVEIVRWAIGLDRSKARVHPWRSWLRRHLEWDRWKPLPGEEDVTELFLQAEERLQAGPRIRRGRALKINQEDSGWVYWAANEALSDLGHSGRPIHHLAMLHTALGARLSLERDARSQRILQSLLQAIQHLPQLIETVEPDGRMSEHGYARQWGRTRDFTEAVRRGSKGRVEVAYQAEGFGLAKLRLRVPAGLVEDLLPILEKQYPDDLWQLNTQVTSRFNGTVDLIYERKINYRDLTDLDRRDLAHPPTLRHQIYILGTQIFYALIYPARWLLRWPFKKLRNMSSRLLHVSGPALIKNFAFTMLAGAAVIGALSGGAVGSLVYLVIAYAVMRLGGPLLKYYVLHLGQTQAPAPKQRLIYREPAGPQEISRPHDNGKSLSPSQVLLKPTPWAPDPGEEIRSYDTLIISDNHLKDPHMRAQLLKDLLLHHRFKHLILLGDFLDYEVDTPLTPEQYEIVRLILQRADEEGVQVTYVPGNHDGRWRSRVGRDIRLKAPSGRTVSIHVQLYARIQLPDGRIMHLEHGDGRDGLILDRKMLQHLGSWAFNHLQELDYWLDRERQRRGIYSEFSFAILGKRLVKRWLRDYRQRVISAAARGQADIGAAGHNHVAEMRYVDGLLYVNTGDDQNPWYAGAVGIREMAPGSTKAEIELLKWEASLGELSVQRGEAAILTAKRFKALIAGRNGSSGVEKALRAIQRLPGGYAVENPEIIFAETDDDAWGEYQKARHEEKPFQLVVLENAGRLEVFLHIRDREWADTQDQDRQTALAETLSGKRDRVPILQFVSHGKGSDESHGLYVVSEAIDENALSQRIARIAHLPPKSLSSPSAQRGSRGVMANGLRSIGVMAVLLAGIDLDGLAVLITISFVLGKVKMGLFEAMKRTVHSNTPFASGFMRSRVHLRQIRELKSAA